MVKNKAILEELYKRSMELTEEMEKSLINFVKKAGGEIKTGNNDRCDAIWGVFYNENSEAYEEHQVLAVKVEHERLFIYTEIYDVEEYNWFATDMVWRTATLTSLCDCLPEYV